MAWTFLIVSHTSVRIPWYSYRFGLGLHIDRCSTIGYWCGQYGSMVCLSVPAARPGRHTAANTNKAASLSAWSHCGPIAIKSSIAVHVPEHHSCHCFWSCQGSPQRLFHPIPTIPIIARFTLTSNLAAKLVWTSQSPRWYLSLLVGPSRTWYPDMMLCFTAHGHTLQP